VAPWVASHVVGKVRVVRLPASGRAPARDAPEGLIQAMAYGALVADLAGDILGLAGFTSMEFALSHGTFAITRQPSGDFVAVTTTGPPVDAADARPTAGLRE